MNYFMKKAGVFILSATVAVLSAVRGEAAPQDLIDPAKTASLTIHKYDLTAASEDGIDAARFTANGERDTEAETTLRNYVIEGVEFTYARVGGIHTESVGGAVKLMYDIPSSLETILELSDDRGDHKHTSDELNSAMKNLLSGEENTSGKNALEKYIAGASGKTAMPLTDSDGVTQATGLPLGLYLLVETKVPANVTVTVDPFFVSLPMTNDTGDYWFYDVDVYPKNQTGLPDLDKLVRQRDDAALYGKPEYKDIATVSEGDTADFILVSRLPKITSESTWLTEYTFVDRMEKGLTYRKDASIYFYSNEEDARANHTESAVKTWAHGASQFSETYEGSNSDYNQMTIAPTWEGLKEIDPGLSQHWMVVAYSAEVNSDETAVLGDSGNTNDVKLTWKRTSMTFADTLEDRARVYTFGIHLKKQFRDASEPGDATKVQFVLKNQTNGYYVTARKHSSGLYYVTDESKEEKDGTVFSPASDGTMVVNGLEADQYILTEIHTSDGFSLLRDPLLITVDCTVDHFTPSQTTLYDIIDRTENPHKKVLETAGDRAKATVDEKTVSMMEDVLKNSSSANARVDMTVINTASFLLPKTGGIGTILFTLAGCGLAFIGFLIVTGKSKKQKSE